LTEAAGHFFPNRSSSPALALAWLVGIAGFCALLGSITEARKREARAVVAVVLNRVFKP
jgi:hypothetical protein